MFLKEGMNVKVVLIPDGDDPDSYSRKHTLAEVEEFLQSSEVDFVDFKASLLLQGSEGDPLARANAINDIADTVALIPDSVKRSVYMEFLSNKLRIGIDALESRVSTTRSKAAMSRPRPQEPVPGEVGSLAPDINPPIAEAAPAVQLTGLDAMEEDRVMGQAERDLLNFILTNGTEVLEFQRDSEFFVDSEEDRQTVFDFISQALEEDATTFANSVYRKVFDEYSNLYYEGYEQDQIVKRLMDGEDRQVAFVADTLSTDERYDLSIKGLRESMMNKGSWLTKYVPKAVLVFQSCRLESKRLEIASRLSEAESRGAVDELEGICVEMMEVQKMIKAVKVKLGREKN